MNLIQEAIEKRPFPQIPLKTKSSFSSFLKSRGIRIGNDGIDTFVESGLIDKLNNESSEFHPFQIWPISRLFKSSEINFDSAVDIYGLDTSKLKKHIDLNWDSRVKNFNEFPSSEICYKFNRNFFPLLLWLESLFMPYARASREGMLHFVGAEFYSWVKWRQDYKLEDLLERHSLDIDQLTEMRRLILHDAHHYDPHPELYLLLRSIPIERRSEFKGKLRIAYDLYEMTELIRLMLEEISQKPVVKEWNHGGPPNPKWVENLFGRQPGFGTPMFLRPLIRYYGLDPAFRVIWLVEGYTEEGFITRYAEALGGNIHDFVALRNFGGDSAFIKKLQAINEDLESAKLEQCFVTITFDETPGSRSRAEDLKQEGLLTMPFILNEPDFELENFEIGELVEVASTWASDLGKSIKTCNKKLAQDIESRISDKEGEDFKRAINYILSSNREQYKLSKNSEWGKRLAEFLLSKREKEAELGKYSDDHLSKIERQVVYVLRNSQPFIHYEKSIENLDAANLEIK